MSHFFKTDFFFFKSRSNKEIRKHNPARGNSESTETALRAFGRRTGQAAKLLFNLVVKLGTRWCGMRGKLIFISSFKNAPLNKKE